MKKLQAGCGKPTGGTVGEASKGQEETEKPQREAAMTARVGSKAPDFAAPAYQRGDFGEVRLSDYLE